MRNKTFQEESKRRRKGFSLVSVVVAASLTSMFLLASAACIVPLYRSIAKSTSDVQLSNAAQSATDLVIGLLNQDSSRPDFDCPKIYGAFRKVNETYPLTAAMFGLPEGATVEVWVRNLAPMPSAIGKDAKDQSLTFDPLLSPTGSDVPVELKGSTEKWGLYTDAGANGWRVIECRVKFGTSQKLLITTLKPVLYAEQIGIRASDMLMTDNSGKVGVARGLSEVSIGAGSSTTAYQSVPGATSHNFTFKDSNNEDQYAVGDIASFKHVALNSSRVGGKSQLLVDSSGGVGQINGDGSSIVNQYLQASDNQAGLDPGNVLDGSVPGESNSNFTSSGNKLSESAIDFSGIAPAPTAPELNSDSIGAVSTDSGALQYSGNKIVSSINVSNNELSASPNSSVRMFVEGSNSSDNSVINIEGNVNSTGSPSQVQIFYNGNGTINIQGPYTVNATIYAPNANVVMNSTGAPLRFSGSITAKNIAGKYVDKKPTEGIKNTILNLDYTARTLDSSGAPSFLTKSIDSLTFDSGKVKTPSRFKVVNVLEPKNPNSDKYNFVN